jgi:hypothetical protein
MLKLLAGIIFSLAGLVILLQNSLWRIREVLEVTQELGLTPETASKNPNGFT